MKITIKTQLITGFGVFLFLIVGLALFASKQLANLNNRMNQIVDVESEKIKLGARINQDVLSISRTEKNILLASTQSEMDEYVEYAEGIQNQMNNRLEILRGLVDNEGRANLDEFLEKWKSYLEVNREIRNLSRKNSNVKAQLLSQGEARLAFDKAFNSIKSIVEKNDETANQANTLEGLREAFEKVKLSTRINRNLVEIQRGEKNFILAKAQGEMDEYAQAILSRQNDLEVRVKDLEGLADAKEAKALSLFKEEFAKYLILHNEVLKLSRENSNIKALNLASEKGRTLNDKATDLIAQIVDKNDIKLMKAKHSSDENYFISRNIMISMTFGLILIGLYVSFIIIRSIDSSLKQLMNIVWKMSKCDLRERIVLKGKNEFVTLASGINSFLNNIQPIITSIQDISIALASASEELQNTAKEMSKNADRMARKSEQEAASLTENSSILHKMADSIKQTSEKMNEICLISDSSKDQASLASKVILSANDSMVKIEKSSSKITSIIAVITEIANQSNLLSLNAAIEAAKAGETGKGFAVVADEVRNLAERSSLSAGEIRQLIEAGANSIQEGNEIINKTETVLNEIIQKIHEISSKISKVSNSISEQDQGIQNISQATEEISLVSGQNAVSSEELSASIQQIVGTTENLSTIAIQLKELTLQFKIDRELQKS